MQRIAIVEDDRNEAASLEEHLMRYAKAQGLSFAAERFDDAEAFADASHAFDLIFMDIDLPGANGMEAARALRSHDAATPLVFVTSLAHLAAHGYAVDAIDFIVKPVSYASLAARMERIMRIVGRNAGKTLALKARTGLCVIELAQLEYVEVMRHYLLYHESGRSAPVEVRGSMQAAQEQLADGPFVRISNSHLVNMGYVRAIEGTSLELSGGERLYFSRSRRAEALRTIANYLGGDL